MYTYSRPVSRKSNQDDFVYMVNEELEWYINEYYKIKNDLFNRILSLETKAFDKNRINYFTTVENRDGLINLSKDGKKAQVSGGYLYDGNNLFIFLEPVTLMVGNKEINLGTMSYVRVNYRNNMEIYNSITGDYEFIAQGDLDVYAFVKDVYVIDLCRDSIIKNDEESFISCICLAYAPTGLPRYL